VICRLARPLRTSLIFSFVAALFLAAVAPTLAKDRPYDLGGRVAYQLLATTYPDNSVFHEVFGDNSVDHNLDARLSFGFNSGGWDVKADGQFIALYGDFVEFTRELPPEADVLFPHLPTDERRLFDLTAVLKDDGKSAALVRFDRLSVGYTSEKGVVRFGRQAVSWGNGLIYTPMDIFNPFDPAAVDREYKTGDDMLYGQYLRNNGHDLQSVLVFRRDIVTGDVESNASSLALKYHGLSGGSEFDALAAQHYGDTLVGAGGSLAVGGAIWRGDLVVTFTEDDTVASLVTSGTYSWTWGGKNVSGVLEYFYSGFGQSGGDYDPDSLAENSDLLERIARGELFTLGQHYIAASAMFEITPLFRLTPNLFTNVADPSALFQVVTQNDLEENLVLLGALNIPVGPDGSEFGGIGSETPGLYLSNGPGIFVQLNWYF
jgi:hypothetical protein